MRQLLVWLQHLLLVLPAIGTVYVTEITSISSYVGYILLALLLLRVAELVPSSAYFLVPLEIIGFGWLYSTYGGLLIFILFSGLISGFLYFRKPLELSLFIVLWGITVNIITADQSVMTFWSANLIGLSFILLLVVINRTNQKHGALEQAFAAIAQSNEQLEQERARTMEYARKVEDYAQSEERGRIANELHDDLGHRLIRVKMMTEAVLQLMDKDSTKAHQLLEQVRSQLEESMNNMRYTVRKLRPAETQQSRRYALHRLIEDAARDLQISVAFNLSGKPYPLYPSVEYVLYRNAQEAITNAVRHGGASAVEIELEFTTDKVRMSIMNNGRLPEAVTYGMGLKGMQERLTMLGGQLQVSLEPAFVISTTVPYYEAHSRVLEGE
jgi:two-component system NarL family sensor kinase